MSELQLITVDPRLTFEERVLLGQYSRRDDALTEVNFPVTDDQYGDWEWKIFHFNRSVSTEEAIRLIQKDGFEPAQIGHILTFGEKNPEKQCEFSIIGLGSVAEVVNSYDVPALWNIDGERGLGLDWFNRDWRWDFCFLGVRKLAN